MASTSKAARIRELLSEGKTTREVADIVGCRVEYVRVAGRQRAGGQRSAADQTYVCKRFGVSDINEAMRLFFRDPAYRKRNREAVARHRERKRLANTANLITA